MQTVNQFPSLQHLWKAFLEEFGANESINAYCFKLGVQNENSVWVSMYFWLCYVFLNLMMLILTKSPCVEVL